MSYFACPHCQNRVDVFGYGEGRRIAETYGVPLLGEIEIDPGIRVGGDMGKPVAVLGEDAPQARSLYAMARAVSARVAEASRRHRALASKLCAPLNGAPLSGPLIEVLAPLPMTSPIRPDSDSVYQWHSHSCWPRGTRGLCT